MNFDRNIAAMLLAPLIGLAAPAAVYFWKMPAGGMTVTETQLMSFSSQPLVVSRRSPPPSYSGINSPIQPLAVQIQAQTPAATFPPGPIPTASGVKQPEERANLFHTPSLSMIYSDGGSRMAIIDGHVLHEGSVVAGHTILKIEKTKVLARTAGKELWLSIE